MLSNDGDIMRVLSSLILCRMGSALKKGGGGYSYFAVFSPLPLSLCLIIDGKTVTVIKTRGSKLYLSQLSQKYSATQ